MASGFGKVAEALAIGIGAGMEGYGKGSLQVALNAREEYQQRLRAQWQKEESAEDRAFRAEEAEKGREFNRELAGEERAWEREKLGLMEASDERKIRLQAALRPKGEGGSKPSETERLINTYAMINARKSGRDKPTDEDWLVGFEKVKGKAGRDDTPAAIDIATFQAQAKYGPDATDAQIAEFLNKTTEKDDTVKPSTIAKDMAAKRAAMEDITVNPKAAREFSKLSEEEKQQVVGRAVLSDYEAAGAKLPEGFSSRYQQSKAEAPQPQAVEAPPTSTQGDTPGTETAAGSGTETDPYVANTPEQQRWVRDHAPPGAYVRVGNKVLRKKAG